jgi:pimeloyl-ACP methyl ester carboxylesterase
MQALSLREHGAWLRYHDLPGHAPACVYIHGLGSSSSSDFPSLVAHPSLAGRRAVLVDLLGFGFSDHPARFSYTLDDHARTVATLLDHLGLESCAIIGHSMGGSVAIVLATMRPDLVGRLVVVEGNLEAGPEEGSNAGFSRSIAAQSEDHFVRTGFQEIVRGMRDYPSFAGPFQIIDPRALHRTAVSLVGKTQPSLHDQLVQAQMPRVYVMGELTLQNEDMARRAVALPREGIDVLIVPRADHGMGLDDDPAEFAILLDAWLDSDT